MSRASCQRSLRARAVEDASGVASASPLLRRAVTLARHNPLARPGAAAARPCMTGRSILAGVLCACLLHGVAHAGQVPARGNAPQAHVRPLTASLARTLDAGLERSESIRRLVDRLEASDVVVYITDESFALRRWIGYLSFLSAVGGYRYLLVHVPTHRTSLDLISAIGHELQHAVEIAEAPAVVDGRSMAQHYQRVGYDVTSDRSGKRFESREAIDAGQRVRRDVNSWRREMPREHHRGESVVLE